MKLHHRAIQTGAAVFCVVISFLLSVTTWAFDGLLDELPGEHNTVVLADIGQLKTSPFFLPTMLMVRQNPLLGSSLRDLEEQLEIDLQNDLQKVAIVTDGPPIRLEMLTDPMDAIQTAASSRRATTIVVQGFFDADQILDRISGEEGISRRLHTDGIEIHRVSANTLAVVSGPDEYRQDMNQRFRSSRGLNPTFRSAFQKLGQQGLYLITMPRLDESVEAIGETADLAGLGIHLGGEIRLRMLLTMGDDEGATASLEEFRALREQLAANPILAIFGLQPLVTNLSMNASGPDLYLNTSMTNNEGRILIQRVIGYLQTANDLQVPLQPGRGSEDADLRKDGVNADFN